MKKKINNEFYNNLGNDWYEKENHPIALLRKENNIRNPWIESELEKHFPNKALTLLDIGCGAGFLTNKLAKNHMVFGIDLSKESLEIAKSKAPNTQVFYSVQNANSLRFEDNTFDAVFAMDLLEHVNDADSVIKEVSRVLKPGGLFFFHTFNRNLLSYLLIIKGVDFFIPNSIKNMHVYHLFIKPKELIEKLKSSNIESKKLVGLSPKICSLGVFDLLFKRKITERFQFKIHKSLLTGYMGYGIKY